jgi:hypothetical protein
MTTVVRRRFGEMPTMAERVLVLERQLADALVRITALEASHDADDQIDGAAPVALSPNWKPLKRAAALVGYSEPGLRKAVKRCSDGRRWWRYVAGRLYVDVDRCPRPAR